MKKRAKILIDGPFLFFDCGFCSHHQAVNEAMPWCAGCFNEYNVVKVGRRRVVESDDQQRTPRFAWAKAVGRMGGVKIGSK